jgi:imidazolonepropionase-like amidohydrolase
MDEDTLREMKQRGTFFVPTIATVVDLIEPGGDYDNPALVERGKAMLPSLRETVRKAQRIGVALVAGTDTSYGERSERRMQDEIAEFVKAGLTPLDAIRAATSNAAACLGIASRTGSIRPGMEADLVVMDRDPLADISALRSVQMVVNNGKIAWRR